MFVNQRKLPPSRNTQCYSNDAVSLEGTAASSREQQVFHKQVNCDFYFLNSCNGNVGKRRPIFDDSVMKKILQKIVEFFNYVRRHCDVPPKKAVYRNPRTIVPSEYLGIHVVHVIHVLPQNSRSTPEQLFYPRTAVLPQNQLFYPRTAVLLHNSCSTPEQTFYPRTSRSTSKQPFSQYPVVIMSLGGLYDTIICCWINRVSVCEDYAFLLSFGQYGDKP